MWPGGLVTSGVYDGTKGRGKKLKNPEKKTEAKIKKNKFYPYFHE